MNEKNFQLKNKSIFFPDKKILAIGDIHLGLDSNIKELGISFSENQFKELVEELESLIEEFEPKKIVVVGDLTHSFSYVYSEKNYFKEFFSFLKSKFQEKDIILIKGNHDTIDYSFQKKIKNNYISKKILFIHGDKLPEKKIIDRCEIVVMGHLHPSVIISDKAKIKREKFKCYLVGKFLSKKIIVLPSFFSVSVGTPINYLEENEKDFSIIPKKDLKNFDVVVIGEKLVYEFGKVKDFMGTEGV